MKFRECGNGPYKFDTSGKEKPTSKMVSNYSFLSTIAD